MSKKIQIPLINIRSRLVELFHLYMENRYKNRPRYSSHCRSMYEWLDDCDDEELAYWAAQGYVFDDANFYEGDDDDDSDVIWPPSSSVRKLNKKNKKGKRDVYDELWEGQEGHKKKHKRGGKRARLINLNQPFSGEEEDPREVEYTDYEEIDDNGLSNGKEIYYYPDYHNKENRLEFSTLSAFNDFCDENGYNVPDHIANDIMYRRVSHVCLRPDAREYGLYEIMAEESYGTLFYEVCEASELG